MERTCWSRATGPASWTALVTVGTAGTLEGRPRRAAIVRTLCLLSGVRLQGRGLFQRRRARAEVLVRVVCRARADRPCRPAVLGRWRGPRGARRDLRVPHAYRVAAEAVGPGRVLRAGPRPRRGPFASPDRGATADRNTRVRCRGAARHSPERRLAAARRAAPGRAYRRGAGRARDRGRSTRGAENRR